MNPINHPPEQANLLTCYYPNLNGLEILYNAWMCENYPKKPNYYLCTPEDYFSIRTELANSNAIFTYKGIKIIRSHDLVKGQIQLV